MNRLQTLFQNKKNNILSVYFTAGFPKPETSVTIIRELEKQGVDMIEIGIPFSDPLADGPVIQHSSQIALKNGMSLSKLFKELENIRPKVKIPLLLMGYFNTVMQFGVETFCQKAAALGIDGVILPDLPLEVYEERYASMFDSYGIVPVFLITPGTNEERIRKVDNLSKGFIYMVSSASTTGTKSGFHPKNIAYFQRVQSMRLKNPVLTGFGISNHETFTQACQFSQGAIVGSAFIKALQSNGTIQEAIAKFVASVR